MSAGTGKTGILDATELVLKDDGSFSYCKQKRASSQIDPLTSRISGRTIAQLREERLTGTHWMRNLGGDVATYLAWTERDADILGDWATPVADGPEPAATKRQRGKTPAKSTRRKFYRANAPQDEQIEVRTRFYMAVAAAIQAFGVSNLKWETTWREVISPPAEAPGQARRLRDVPVLDQILARVRYKRRLIRVLHLEAVVVCGVPVDVHSILRNTSGLRSCCCRSEPELLTHCAHKVEDYVLAGRVVGQYAQRGRGRLELEGGGYVSAGPTRPARCREVGLILCLRVH